LEPRGFIRKNDRLKRKLGEMYQYALHLKGFAVLNIKTHPKTGKCLSSFNKIQMCIMRNAEVPLLFKLDCYKQSFKLCKNRLKFFNQGLEVKNVLAVI
jgi:hypothetical protein